MSMKLRLFLLLAAWLLSAALPGQANPSNEPKPVHQNTRISLVCKDKDLKWIIASLEKKTGLLFVYSNDELNLNARVSCKIKDAALQDALQQIFEPLNIRFELAGKNVLLKKAPAITLKGTPVILQQQQLQEIRGRVVDEAGNPVQGATVQVKGSQLVTTTNATGEFVINTPDEKLVLVISFVGYLSEEIAVSGNKSVLISLKPGNQQLGEVVVVGYGTQRKVSVTGAVDQVKVAEMAGRPTTNLTQALQGMSPNLIIQQPNAEPGARINMNIRGIGTLGDNSPLVVIDGLVGGDINLLNPSDIENISVLKDAGSAAIYGSRSSNGVVLITTKKGKKNEKATVTYNGMVGIQKPHIWYKPVESFENAILRNQAMVNSDLQPIYSPEQIRQFQREGSKEWFLDEILQDALQQNHNISVSGGNDKTTYLISGGYVNQENNLVGPGLGLKRYNFRMNLSTEAGRLKLTGVLAYARNETKDHSYSTSTLIVDAGRTPTYYNQKDEQGRYLTNEVLGEFNPLGILEKGGYRKYDDDNVFANITAELSIMRGLKLRGVVGGTLAANHVFERVKQVNFFPKGIYGADRNTNDRYDKNLFLNTQLLLEYVRGFGDNNVNALIGFANESSTNQQSKIYMKNTDPDLGIPISETIIDREQTQNSNKGNVESSLNSVFGRAGYSFDDKYFAEFNFRFDGSSKFRKDLRWGFFPSVAIGYRITEEAFMDNYRDKFGNLKLRASYGILGNQNVNNYQFQTTYEVFNNAYGFNNQGVSGTRFTFANPDLKWERAATFNAGVDATFLKNTLQVSFDYFNKLTSDILIRPAVTGVYGGTVADYNAGKVRNQGWELSVSYRLAGRNLVQTFGFNIADTRNEVVYFDGNERITSADEMQMILKEGLPFNSYIGLKRDGYFQNLDEILNGAVPTGLNVRPGDIRYVNRNKDGVIDDQDKFVLGNPFPRYTFGFNYNVSYKSFDLALFVQGVGKRDMFLRGELVEPFHFNYSQVMYQHQLDYWTPVNPNAKFPRLAAAGSESNTNNFRRGSDLYLFDAAYARLKNVQIGYSIPLQLLQRAGLRKARVYLTGQNLLTFSGLDFVDPELSEFDNSLKNSGANSGRAYPTPLYFGIGLDITF
jgi:TonB-linked SusC/RagA family outer membrane protein